MAGEKAAGAFRTIGELATELGVPQHRLRYWESRFPQLRPLTRAGQRRYYRPEDVALARRIHAMLGQHGYTIRGVQQQLATEAAGTAPADVATPSPPPAQGRLEQLRAIRALLAGALEDDAR